jgi:hypothetical protein
LAQITLRDPRKHMGAIVPRPTYIPVKSRSLRRGAVNVWLTEKSFFAAALKPVVNQAAAERRAALSGDILN